MQELPTEKIKKQFDILGDVSKNPIIVEYIPPKIQGGVITFRNDVIQNCVDRSVKAQKYFNYCKQYVAFFKSKSYQFLFKDYSLGRIVIEFDDDNKLVMYNMYWNPCPFNKEFIEELEKVDLDIVEYIDNIEQKEKLELDCFSLRSPLRFDFSSNYSGENIESHPAFHMHFQDSETRSHTDTFFSVYRYFLFIFENCYPDIYRKKQYEEYVEQIRKLDKETKMWLKIKRDARNLGEKINTVISMKER